MNKNIIKLLLAASIIIFYSCDPSSFATYRILNNTSQDLNIIQYSDNNDTLSIMSHKEEIIASLEDMGGRIYLSYVDKDSITINDYSSNVQLKIFYPNSYGKNIYNTENREVWIENKKGKMDYEYTFEITEEDIVGGEGQ